MLSERPNAAIQEWKIVELDWVKVTISEAIKLNLTSDKIREILKLKEEWIVESVEVSYGNETLIVKLPDLTLIKE